MFLLGLLIVDNVITADNTPLIDDIIYADLAFHLGDRSKFHLSGFKDILLSNAPPDKVFTGFRIRDGNFLIGELYKECFDITAKGIEQRLDCSHGKVVRNCATINRDILEFDPNLYYLFDTEDARAFDYKSFYGTSLPLPVFQYHRRKGLSSLVVPLHNFHNCPSWNIPFIRDSAKFDEKIPKIFWRGALSGTIIFQDKLVFIIPIVNDRSLDVDEKKRILRSAARFLLCEYSQDCDFIDAGLIMKSMPAYPDPPEFLIPLTRPRATHHEQLSYRYLLALDGNDGPSSWYWQLQTNSLIMRQESEWEMFADNYFKPWIHYVPIAGNLNDIYDKFSWCENNRDSCKKIIGNAQAAWRLLFSQEFQRERQKHFYSTYASWFK